MNLKMPFKISSMGRRSKLQLPPIDLGDETIGDRISRFRKEKGMTQVELARKMGIVQTLITDYERGKLRLHAEMVARFTRALNVTADELIGLKNGGDSGKEDKPSLRLLRRLKKIDLLPEFQQKTLLQTIDTFLKGAGITG